MCKRKIRVKICVESDCRTVEAELHPRGCMGASRTHLDLPEEAIHPMLLEASASRGMRFSWERVADCLVLHAPGLPEAKICGPVPEPRAPPLLRRLRRGRVYLGL